MRGLVLAVCMCVGWAYCEQESVMYGLEGAHSKVTLTQVDNIESVPQEAAVYAVFDNKINETGWSFLEIHSSANCSDDLQSYAAGYIEGHITRDLIYMHYLNTVQGFCEGQQDVCKKIDKYIEKNSEWIKQMVEEKSNESSYWYQVKLYLNQLQGLADGYNEGAAADRKLSYKDILYINLSGDLEDLVAAFKGVGREFADSKCSALIKILPDFSDVLTSHVTWSSYQSMLRVQKKYVLHLHTMAQSSKTIPGHSMSFSSYPGALLSIDDFYVLSSRMIVLETTIGNSNPDLWRYIVPVGQLPMFLRVMVTNRLAVDGRGWVSTFRKMNSGTYNNQWMVVDYKRYTPGSTDGVQKDFLWVLEQLPGLTEARDMSDVLRAQTYWPSYNIAYFPNIFNMSGGPTMVARYGAWFSYGGHPRARLFHRDHASVRCTQTMLALMTYNDFRHDPLSSCQCIPPYSAENAISARNDLNMPNGSYPFPSLSYRSHGAIDVKISGRGLSKGLQFLSVSGPVHNVSRGLPPFAWSTAGFGNNTPHHGHPDLWKFSPITYKWLENK